LDKAEETRFLATAPSKSNRINCFKSARKAIFYQKTGFWSPS